MFGWVGATALLSLLAWFYLRWFRGFFWRCDRGLARETAAPPRWPKVAAIVPARDEAATLAVVARALLAQDYPGGFHVILVDDRSRDATGTIARDLAASDPRLIAVAGGDLAIGWTGKIWAQQQGIEAALQAQPDTEFFFFTDADIYHAPETLRALVAKAETERLDLVSLMARLRCRAFWERQLIPAYLFFFQKLYPFAWIADPKRATAGAAGGCILVRRAALEKAGGLAAIRGRLIDDCALAAAVKAAGGRLWIGLADRSLSLRAYDRLSEIWAMVARSAFTQLRHSPLLLLGTLLGMALLYLAPPLAIFTLGWHRDVYGAIFGAIAWSLMASCYRPSILYFGRDGFYALALPIAALFYLAMTLDSARVYWRHGGNRWKGRDYGAAGESGA